MKKLKDEYKAVYNNLLRKWNPELPEIAFGFLSGHEMLFMEGVRYLRDTRFSSSSSFSNGHYTYKINHAELQEAFFYKMFEVFEFNYNEVPTDENFFNLAVIRVLKNFYDNLKKSGSMMNVTHSILGKCNIYKDIPIMGFINMSMCKSITERDRVYPGMLAFVKPEKDNPVLKVYPRVFRIVCSNGSIRPCKNMDSLNFNILERDITELDGWLKSSIREAVLNREVFKMTADEMRMVAQHKIDDPVEFLKTVSENKWHITRFSSILYRYAHNNIYSIWGMANAMTEEARDIRDIEEAVELEQQAGALVMNAPKKPCIRWDQFYVCPGNGEMGTDKKMKRPYQ